MSKRGRAMAGLYRRAMDIAYLVCVVVAGAALVAISAIMPWAVFTRYVLNSAASWPETAAVLLTVVVTFFGAAACYRLGLHMNVAIVVDTLPPRVRRITDFIVEIAMAVMAIFMVVYGYYLCEATWNNSIAEFPWLRVGIAYSPIPMGGFITLLFIIEHLTIGRPRVEADPHAAPAPPVQPVAQAAAQTAPFE
jgi:TRAP-type C4-dicarboxylate transport system permease small subunit